MLDVCLIMQDTGRDLYDPRRGVYHTSGNVGESLRYVVSRNQFFCPCISRPRPPNIHCRRLLPSAQQFGISTVYPRAIIPFSPCCFAGVFDGPRIPDSILLSSQTEAIVWCGVDSSSLWVISGCPGSCFIQSSNLINVSHFGNCRESQMCSWKS